MAQNRERYNRVAAFYEWAAQSGSWFSAFYRAVSDSIEADPGALLLDMGCGPGTLTPYVLPKVSPGGAVVGTDISDEMIERARTLSERRGWLNARFVRSDVRDFAPDQPVGIIVFCLSLSTMPEPGQCFARALSWLKPGGQLVILDSFLGPQAGRLARLAIRIKSPLVGADPSAISLADLKAGLDSVRVQDLHGGVYTLLSGRKPLSTTAAA